MQAASTNVGASAGALWILLMAVPIGALWGLVQLHIASGCLFVGSKLFGAKSSYKRMRTVVALSYAPLATALVFWLGAALTLGSTAFVSPDALAGQGQEIIFGILGLYLATCVCAAWSLVVLGLGVAESEGISVPRAFGVVVGSFLLAAVVLGVIMAAIALPLLLRH
jgi:hypothetical protein